MKTTLAILLVLCASSSFAQSLGTSVRSARPVATVFESYAEHAVQKPMAKEQSILYTASNAYAKGERPLWEVAKPAPETPLGDVARKFREQHASVRKAVKVFEQ